MNYFKVFIESFYSYAVEILPYFLLAVVITAFLQAHIKVELLRKSLGKGKLSAVFTAILGGLMPVCSCSMIPVANLINNFSRGYSPVIAFLIVAPVVSPITILLTYGFFGLEVAMLRVFGTLIFALGVAYLTDLLFKKNPSIPLGSPKSKKESILTYIKENLLFTGRYLIIGIFVASLIKTLVPQKLVGYIANTPLSYPLISLLSIPVYVCSGEEVPIAKALVQVGFTYGNAFTFMLASSGICLPTVFAVKSFLPLRVIAIYTLSWFLFSSLLGLVFDLLLF